MEGVSLTCQDELARWSKYGFGCSEMLFNGFRKWPTKGPFAKLFRSYLWSDSIPIHSKISTFGYISSYVSRRLSMPCNERPLKD